MTGHVRLTGLREAGAGGAPTVLQRSEQAFLPAILAQLEAGDDLAELTSTVARARDDSGLLKLFHPVQRTFHVTLLESFCSSPGEPRLATSRIDSMGLVLRRVAVDGSGKPIAGRRERWCSAGAELRGWLPLSPLEEDEDPDPARRPPPVDGGHPEITRRLNLLFGVTEPLTEAVSPLFTAPPAACEALRRTVVYGMVPVTSSDISQTPGAGPEESYGSAAMRQKLVDHFVKFLKAGGPYILPKAGASLSAADATSTDPQMQAFVAALRQVAIELDAFGDGPEAKALLRALDQIVLPLSEAPQPQTSRPAGQFLRDASRLLLELTESPVKMPLRWPVVTPAQADAILQASQAGLTARRAAVKPNEGRFDGAGRRYVIRAFVRVRNDDGCPPELVWSGYSEPFRIAQWFESGDAPPVQIALPDLSSREALRRLKPNVAFAVPESLQNMLAQNLPKKFLDGEGSKGSGGVGIDWLCSFSLPIITLCAFIVLNIFLALLNIVFNWMLFIKICIPIPKRD